MTRQESLEEEGVEESKKVVLGGTFTQLHKGHKKLLRKAVSISSNIEIGLVADEATKGKMLSHMIEDFKKRKNILIKFLKKIKKKDLKVRIVPIHDPYGPSIHDPHLTDIVVTEETLPRAVEINKIRKRKNLRPLHIHVVKMVEAKDGRYIRSSRIRCGEIDKEGNVLANLIEIKYKDE